DQQAELEATNAKLTENATKHAATVERLEGQLGALSTRIAELETKANAAQKAKLPPPLPPISEGPPAKIRRVVLGDAQLRGKDTALVTIVQYSDFQCPHCATTGATLDELAKKYGDDVRFAFKHYPLTGHDRAMPAAIAAEAAGEQDKFWEMHDKLFDNNTALTDTNFEVWAKELGLDVAQFKRDLKDPALKKRVEGMKRDGEDLEVMGTPDFYVNGHHLESGNAVADFVPVIDAELARARALVASGTAPTNVYREAIRG
ncbi:MAG: thioredoxin domain-containing protein, partial [Myxococcota bacterium]